MSNTNTIILACGVALLIMSLLKKKSQSQPEQFQRTILPLSVPSLSLNPALDSDADNGLPPLEIPQPAERQYGLKPRPGPGPSTTHAALPTQDDIVHPFNTSVYGPSSLSFDTLIPARFIGHPEMEDRVPVTTADIGSLRQSVDGVKSEIRQLQAGGRRIIVDVM